MTKKSTDGRHTKAVAEKAAKYQLRWFRKMMARKLATLTHPRAGETA